METILEKIEVIQNWCRYYNEILGNFSKIFLVKLGKNFEKIFVKFFKIVGNTSHKLKIKTFWWKLCEIFLVIFRRTYEILYGNFK